MKKYLLFPGMVTSRFDGQDHYISASKLAQLYGVPMEECMVFDWSMNRTVADMTQPLIELDPRYDGNYDLADAVRRMT